MPPVPSMQSGPSDRVPSGPDEDSLSPDNSSRRRRTSDRSTRTTQELDPANTPPMGRRTLTTSSPQRGGSSRDMTPPESAGGIKYTRTGRVSKATKGQRVHHCDECGKTYTRAEHLRRHQQNHKPGAFPCDVPGCSRSFYREDLLMRHKARHNDPNNPPSRPASPSSQGSAPFGGFKSVSRTSTIEQGPIPTRTDSEQGEREQSSTRDYPPDYRTSIPKQPPTQFPRAGLPPVTLGAINTDSDYFLGGLQWDPSSPCSPSGYDSPTNGVYHPYGGPPYFQPQFSRERYPSDTSYLAYYPYNQTSRSPVSAGSSTIHLPLHQWGQGAHDPNFQHFGTSFGSDNSFQKGFNLYNGQMADQPFHLGTFDSQRLLTPEDRDYMEHDDLLVPAPSPQGSTTDFGIEEIDTNETRYLGAYWRWIHQLFPVVHRPSFNLSNASPLLRAAMLALGAHALQDTADRRNARIIHERCVKVVKKRTLNSWHSYRTCDMQAIVLMEVYSIFKSRRPPLQLSKIFQDVYLTLANDVAAVGGEISSDSILASHTLYLDEISLAVDTKCRQRLLLACYILDQQHAALFGRQRTNCFSGAGVDLPFPNSQTSWDATQGHHSNQATPSQVWEAMDPSNRDEIGHRSYDVFQSMLMMATMADRTDFDGSAYSLDPNILLSRMEQSSMVKLAYHTFMLCKHTPVRDVLGVAGESWVMAEKLSSQAEYTAAQIRTRHWAKGVRDSATEFDVESSQLSVSSAITHALTILELHLNHPKTGLLFQEWAVYLASIVVWARAHLTASKLEQGHRLSVANTPERRPSVHDLDQELPSILKATAKNDVNLEQAKTILLWAKARIETVDIPHNCGLTNGALDVLGKLVARGGEDGWFGS